MKTGLSLVELAQKIDAQSKLKVDYIAAAARTRMSDDLKLVLEDHGEFPLQPLAHRQIGTFVDIGAKYYDRMRQEAPSLLATNVNEWMGRSDKSRMVRTLDGKGRAYLSNSYSRVDYVDVAKIALPVLMNDLPNTQIVSAEVTDSRLYIHFTTADFLASLVVAI